MISLRKRAPFSPLAILVALLFGGSAFAIVAAGFAIQIPGASVVTDPRGIFVTIGSALTGPVGGILIGVMAGIAEPAAPAPSIVAHVAGGLWLGFSYRRIICDHLQMPAALLIWAPFVLVYYYAFVIPGFVLGGLVVGTPEAASPIAYYLTLARGVLPEALITTVVTTVVLAALPRRCRRPLW